MSARATAVAPSNIAFVKYWGARDLERALPYDASISMTLSRCVSRCTVELRPPSEPVSVLWRAAGGAPEPAPPSFRDPVARHLERLGRWAGVEAGFRVSTENSFPTGAGIASSASGFAALALAATAALGRSVSPRRLSVLARLSGSGSAARSALGGYVEWPAGDDGDEAWAEELAPADHWALSDLVAVVDASPKTVSSRDGHRAAPSSPFFARRRERLPERLERVRDAIRRRRIDELGPVIEDDAIDLHLVAMSSRPPIFYWCSATLEVLEAVRRLRAEGVQAYWTIDAGPNVHVICEAADEERVAARIEALRGVERLIRDRVGPGPRLVEDETR